MTACEPLAPELTAHASGEPASAALAAHLPTCAACQAELASTRALLGEAALPVPSERELRALDVQRGATRNAWNRQQTRRLWLGRSAAALVAMAAALLIVLGPWRGRPAVIVPASDDLALDTLADGPIELAEEELDPATFDPEISPTVYSEEGDE